MAQGMPRQATAIAVKATNNRDEEELSSMNPQAQAHLKVAADGRLLRLQDAPPCPV